MTTVSVVVTTHNRPDLLDGACSSVLAQTHPDLELIVVDDGSSPPANLGLTSSDPRVTLVRRENANGPSAARNVGLDRARGKWVTFLDDDDRLLPDMVERSIAAAERSSLPPPVAVWSAVRFELPTGEVLRTGRPIDLVRGGRRFAAGAPSGYTFACAPTLVVETEVLRDLGGWDEALFHWEQADLCLRLEEACSIQALPRVTYVVVDHEGTRQHQKEVARASAIVAIVDKHPITWRENRGRRARLLASAAASYQRGGDRRAALRTSLRAIRAGPFAARGYRQLLRSAVGGTDAASRLEDGGRGSGGSEVSTGNGLSGHDESAR